MDKRLALMAGIDIPVPESDNRYCKKNYEA